MSDCTFRLGERVEIKQKTLTITPLDLEVLPRVRAHLIELARRDTTATYGQLKSATELPHAINGLGRLLDLVGEECERRDEPPLSALVVTTLTGEVGNDYLGDAVRERREVHAHWRDR